MTLSRLRRLRRLALRPAEEIKPSEWAEKYRRLPRGQSPRPGPWRNTTAPYLRLMMDLVVMRGIVEINVVKAAQIGVSEAFRNVIGWCAHISPEPAGLALPSRDKGRKIVRNRIIPLFRDNLVFGDLMTERSADMQSEQIRLVNGFLLHLMWSGSATAMASDPMRLVICDEVDKFEGWTGEEADPVSLVAKRTRAYGDRARRVNISTPTTRFGKIWQLVEASNIRLYYYVPCPHCDTWQRLVFSRLRWTEEGEWKTQAEHAAYLVSTPGAVWYECSECGDRIEEDDRADMVRRGEWRQSTEDGPIIDAYGQQHVSADTVRAWPRGTRIGMHISALYCLWESWASIVAEYIRAQGNMSAMYDFRTETLGEPFDQLMIKTEANLYERKTHTAPLDEGIVPAWAARLIVTIDTQHTHFYAVLRAWGPGMRSARVWHNRVETFDELDDLFLRRPWKNENPERAPMLPALILIDAGGTRLEGEKASRTVEVYKWAWGRRAKVRPIRGASKPRRGLFIWPGKGFISQSATRRRRESRVELRIWFLDTHHFGDELADFVNDENERWMLNRRHDDDYNRQLSNAVKVVVRRGAKLAEEWVPAHHGAPVHYWDCEVYQIAGAYMAEVHTLPSEEEMEKLRQAPRRRRVGRMGRTA